MEDSIDFIGNTCAGKSLYAASSMFLGHKAVIAIVVMMCVNIHTFTDFLSYAKLVVHS